MWPGQQWPYNLWTYVDVWQMIQGPNEDEVTWYVGWVGLVVFSRVCGWCGPQPQLPHPTRNSGGFCSWHSCHPARKMPEQNGLKGSGNYMKLPISDTNFRAFGPLGFLPFRKPPNDLLHVFVTHCPSGWSWLIKAKNRRKSKNSFHNASEWCRSH